ncbi:hypothetical protein N0V85_005155 [Neurospora sp. IMI 360204]|nr:hypothetical protein N0V85_005155 [Neurospora sp. IMI 360204]
MPADKNASREAERLWAEARRLRERDRAAAAAGQHGITIADFTIRHWLSHRTFGAPHVEIAAIAQALEEVIKRNDQHHPDTSTVKIFTDSGRLRHRPAGCDLHARPRGQRHGRTSVLRSTSPIQDERDETDSEILET